NISLRMISLIGALAITLFAALLLWLGRFALGLGVTFQSGLVLAVGLGLFAFIATQFLIDTFIYRRIKLIYKIIRKSKVSMPDKRMVRHSDSPVLDMVEQEVEKWADSQHKEIETLKTLEAYRKRFIGNVSHELKTPIFSIQGYIDTLIDGGLYDEKVNLHYLQRAASNVERLLSIVKNLEEINKLESEDHDLDIRRFDIKALVREVFEDFEVAARQRNITLTFKEGADRSWYVTA